MTHGCACCEPIPQFPLPPCRSSPSACSQRVNSVQRLRHSLLRADRLLEKHEDDVSGPLAGLPCAGVLGRGPVIQLCAQLSVQSGCAFEVALHCMGVESRGAAGGASLWWACGQPAASLPLHVPIPPP